MAHRDGSVQKTKVPRGPLKVTVFFILIDPGVLCRSLPWIQSLQVSGCTASSACVVPDAHMCVREQGTARFMVRCLCSSSVYGSLRLGRVWGLGVQLALHFLRSLQ